MGTLPALDLPAQPAGLRLTAEPEGLASRFVSGVGHLPVAGAPGPRAAG